MKKAALYDEARRLYVEEGKTLAQIAKQLHCSPTTVSAWKKDGDWEQDRQRHRQELESIWDLIPKLVRRTCESVAADLERGEVDPQKLHAVRSLLSLVVKPRRVDVPVVVPAEGGEKKSPEDLRRLIEQVLQTEYGVRG